MNVANLVQLKPEEEVIMTVHQSLIPWWPKFLLAVLWVLLPFFLLFPLFQMRFWGVMIFLALLVSGAVYALRTFLAWHRSVFIITDRRIIDHDQRGLFSRVVSEAPYSIIQDVSYKISGFWPTILRYGDVTVQIRGNAVNLEIFHVRRPHHVHDLLNDLRLDLEEKSAED
jgi:uncharacterized membrane protein YdbT with pleckstrin-like domain